jgi:hypothetical protein
MIFSLSWKEGSLKVQLHPGGDRFWTLVPSFHHTRVAEDPGWMMPVVLLALFFRQGPVEKPCPERVLEHGEAEG